MKLIATGGEALEKIRTGVNKVADIVKMTLGPKGNNTILDKKYSAPLITNDGVTIAREIYLPDVFENVGANIVKEAAIKTNDVAGDGTTTAMILAQAMVNEGIKNISNGAKAIELRKGMEIATKKTVELIKLQAKAIHNKDDIANVATISSSDPDIGKLIAEVMELVGKDGIITVEESSGMEVEKEVVSGMQFPQGYLSPYFISEDAKAVLLEPYILITDRNVVLSQEYIPLLEQILKQGKKDILIIAEDIQGEALASLILNKVQKRINCVAVKAPYFGDRRTDFLQDLAVLTGGKVITSALNQRVEQASLDDLGTCHSIVIDKSNTVIVGGDGNPEELKQRIKDIKSIKPENQYETDWIKDRLAKLSGGIGIIKVGSITETERNEKKLRVEDAVEATKAAVAEGIVAGGGVCLLDAKEALENHLTGDQRIGFDIVANALTAPIKQLAENCGISGEVVIDKITYFGDGIGYDGNTGEYVDMVKEGIIDPAKVVRSALQNATSVASSLLTTQAIITDERENEKAQ